MIPTEMPPQSTDPRLRSLLEKLGQRSRRAIPPAPTSSVVSAEDEDAHMTGMTRSLQRRILGLNFPVRGEAMPPARKMA